MVRRGAALVLALLAVPLLAGAPLLRAAELAPGFHLYDIDGVPLNSTDLVGRVVLLQFSGTWCVPCKIVEKAFSETLYPQYGSQAVFISAFIPPANLAQNVLQYRQSRGLPWHLATDNDTVSARYSVATIPRIFVIDKSGYVTEDWEPPPLGFTDQTVTTDIGAALRSAIAGNAPAISLTALSIPALLVIAALLSFFSPCSFPVLPAFMSFYLNLDAKGQTDPAKKPTTKTAAGRGFIASLGIVTVYGIIALVVFAASFAAQAVLPWVSPVVGVVLIVFGILTLLPYQYHFLTRPFIALKKKIAAKLGGGNWQPGVGTKLFAFGAGYGAAGFACVAPPFIGAILNASALGRPQDALLGLALYVIIVIVTMIAVVVGLHIAGDRMLKKIRVWSGAIKYVSAAALMIAGAYLLWLFGSAYL